MATSSLNFCMADSGLDLPLGAGAAGFDFVAGVGSMYTDSGGAAGSGVLVSWAVARVSKFMGIA